MVEVEHVRKAVVVSYDTDAVQGTKATVLASHPDGPVVEKKTVANKGHVALAFPADYDGECFVEVHGSRSGEDSGIIKI